MSKTRDALPDAALFAADGHLTEVALACAADGETDLLCAGALEHLDGCDRCTHQLGEAALFSIVAGEALGDRAALAVAAPSAALIAMIPSQQVTTGETPVPISAQRRLRRPLPKPAIAAALLVAMVTAGPALLGAIQSVPAVLSGALAAAPFLFRVASAFVRAPWGVGSVALLVKVVSAVILAGVGLQVARITSRSGSWQQGGV